MTGNQGSIHADRDRFYGILQELESRIGFHRLAECYGRMGWPARGVYFFFEAGEVRLDGVSPRMVRVGTHAVSSGSKTTLWNRLSNHRGTAKGTGNHRGSIFRCHVGTALLNRGAITLSPNTWSQGSSAPRDVREAEQNVERAVSAHIGKMPFLWVEADDRAGTDSIRAVLERNSTGLLSKAGEYGTSADPASEGWLGHHTDHESVRTSALWNVREITGGYERSFLGLLEECASRTEPLSGSRMATVALVSCVKQKRSSPCAAQHMYTSPLFQKSRAYADSVADAWFILSARYGLLRPETSIEPYEQTLKEASASQRRAWAAHVHEQMTASGLLVPGTRFIWLAGMDYQRDLARRLHGFEQIDPLRGMRFGERLAWLATVLQE